jgi:uncharacterized membrane protein
MGWAVIIIPVWARFFAAWVPVGLKRGKNTVRRLLGLVLSLTLLLPSVVRAQTPPPVVHAIIFYAPTCPHCHEVITQHLIPLQNQYGSRLALLGLDTSQPYANTLYYQAIRHFELPQEDWVVPILVVGEEVLIGGIEIPARFPGIVETGLQGEGIDLPDFPPLLEFLDQQGMLDTRYPDRRVVRQATQPPAQDEPTPARDTVVAADSAAAGDSLPQDTVAVADPGARTDTTGTEVPAVRTDTTAAGGTPAGDPVSTDTGVAGGAAAPGRDTASGAVNPADTPVPEDSIGQRSAPGTPVRPHGTPVDPPTAGEPGEARAPLGMEEVVQELESRTMWDRFRQDPTGNSISVLVLLGMLFSLLWVGYPPRAPRGVWPDWVLPALVVVGVGVAAYLSYIEITQTEATCGPVGDCNTVNQSEYATLFGFLPVGVLGLMGYAGLLLLWVLERSGPAGFRSKATLGIWAGAFFGTLFSVYLTFLEPFVIGATCMWCLSSAVVMTLLLWYAAPRAREVWPGSDGQG